MTPKDLLNGHIKPLEQAMSARFGWETGASWRDELVNAVRMKADRLNLDETAYCRLAMASAGELEVLAEMVSNSETRFFREPGQFDALSRRVIPELMKERANERRLDIWSAACSSGEEAYSLAILLREALPDDAGWEANLFATDLRGSAIIAASMGRYASSSIGAISPQLRAEYFVEAGMNGREETYGVQSSVRKMISFQRANIYDQQFWKNMGRRFDLVVCNNLFIYFHALAVKQTVDRIASVLNPGGLLMVMENETGYVVHAALKRDASLPGFFRKA